MNTIVRLLYEADGELSAIGHRGSFDKDEVLDLSARIRKAIPLVEEVHPALSWALDLLQLCVQRLETVGDFDENPELLSLYMDRREGAQAVLAVFGGSTCESGKDAT